MAFTSYSAVLLHNGNKQILPVSKANLIELVNSYKTSFGGADEVQTALAYLANTYIPNATQEAKDYTDAQIDAIGTNVAQTESGKAITSIIQTEGVVTATSGNIDAKYVNVEADYGTENNTVETVLSYLKGQIDDARGDGEITITKTSDSSYTAIYTITQNSETKGTINIPKDMVATNGELVHGTLDGTTFTPSANGYAYIKMTIANGNPFYIDVKDLVEDNEFDNTTEITFAKDSTTGHISANVATIAATKISYNGTNVDAELGLINSKIDTLKGNDTVSGSVAKSIKDAVEALDSTAATAKTENGFTYVLTGVEEADGLLTNTTYAALSDENIKTVPFDSTSYLYQLLGADEIANVDDVHDALNAIANRVKVAAGDGVTEVIGDTNNTYVNVSATKEGNTVTLTVDDSYLGNVSHLQYDELSGADTEAFTLFGAND